MKEGSRKGCEGKSRTQTIRKKKFYGDGSREEDHLTGQQTHLSSLPIIGNHTPDSGGPTTARRRRLPARWKVITAVGVEGGRAGGKKLRVNIPDHGWEERAKRSWKKERKYDAKEIRGKR